MVQVCCKHPEQRVIGLLLAVNIIIMEIKYDTDCKNFHYLKISLVIIVTFVHDETCTVLRVCMPIP